MAEVVVVLGVADGVLLVVVVTGTVDTGVLGMEAGVDSSL